MSRFFARSDSESETESSEDEQQVIAKAQTQAAAAFGLSDDEDDVKRVVRSAIEKRFVLLSWINSLMYLLSLAVLNDFSTIFSAANVYPKVNSR